MMLKELAIEAVRSSDTEQAGRVVDILERKGFKYLDIFEVIREWIGVGIAEWDALLENL